MSFPIPSTLLTVAVATVTATAIPVAFTLGEGEGEFGGNNGERGGALVYSEDLGEDYVLPDGLGLSVSQKEITPDTKNLPGSLITQPSPSYEAIGGASSAIIGIICVGIVFGTILVVVGIWQLKEWVDGKRAAVAAAKEKEMGDLEKGGEGILPMGNIVVVSVGERRLRILD